MRKRVKSKGTTLDVSTEPLANIFSGAAEETSGLNSVDALPNETLQLIFVKLPFPSRQYASLVCRRWRDLLLEAPFCRHVVPSQSLSEALQACSPGDTLICPPGMYQETLLVDKPVRVVAEDHWRAEQRQRRRRSRGLAPEPQQQAAPSPHQHQQPKAAIEAGAGPGPSAPPEAASRPAQDVQNPHQQQLRLGPGGGSGRQRGGLGGGGGGGGTRPSVPSVTVISLRPPVVVMDSRCCFVGFEFHTSVAHNEVSICCFGPNSPMARFDRCTFSGLTGLRVPYSKGSQTRLELYDCTLIGTTQSLAAVQMDAGRLLLVRCALQNNSVGVEVGPEALARLADCEVRWCGTALVVDGCLAMANCRLWGNGKVGNVSTETRLRAAQCLSEACLAAGVLGGQQLALLASPQAEQQQQQSRLQTGSPTRAPRAAAAAARAAFAAAAVAAASPPSRACGRGRRGAGAAAAARDAAGGNPQAGGSPAGATVAPADEAAALDGTMAVVSAASEPGGTGPDQAAQQAPPSSAASTAAAVAVAVLAAGGGSGSGPARVAALAAAQRAEVEAAFSARQQLVRVVGCEVAAPQLIMRTGLHKDVRKKARELVRQVYGAPDDDLFPEWEVLVQSDLDSDLDDEDSSVTSGSVMADADEEDMEDEDLDPLDAADDPDLDESGESHSGSDSDSDSESGSGSGSGLGDEGDAGEADTEDAVDGVAGADGGGGEMEDDDEEYNAGDPMSSGSSSAVSSSSSGSDSDSSNDSGSDNSGESGSSSGGGTGSGDVSESD